jgi:hypothetical protein
VARPKLFGLNRRASPRPYLGAPGGEIPSGDSTVASILQRLLWVRFVSVRRPIRKPGTTAGRFAGTGIPAVKSFPHRAPRSVIGEERRLAIRHGARGATRKFA